MCLNFHFKPYTIVLVVLLACSVKNTHGNDDNGTNESDITWKSLISTVKQSTRSVISYISPTLMKILSEANVSRRCEQSLTEYTQSIVEWKPWAIRMLDATGKVPSGVLEGTGMEFGAFEECLGIRVNESAKNSTPGEELFRGRYCTVGFQSILLSSSTNSKEDIPEMEEDLVKYAGHFLKAHSLWIGICVPSDCSKGDLQNFLSVAVLPFGVKSSISECHADEPLIWSSSSIAAICVMCCLAGLCFAGTVCDAVTASWVKKIEAPKEEGEYMLLKVVKSFSVWTNSEMLFKASHSNDISCFHGIRFLTATWVMLGHVYHLPDHLEYPLYRRFLGLFEMYGNLPGAVIENFSLSVSTFFVLSGFLLVKTTWSKLKKDGKLNFFEFILHKYWRMTPALGFTFLLLFTLPLVDSGPLWTSSLDPETKKCEGYWWANFLYISNWFSFNAQGLGHTWYLSALMQLHIVGVCLLIAFHRWKLCAVFSAVFVSICCLTATAFAVVWRNHPRPVVAVAIETDEYSDYLLTIYIKPYFHFTSYLIGMITACICEKYGDRKIAVKYQVLGWLIALFLAMFPLYAVYLPTEERTFDVFYLTVHRTTWSLSIGWLIYVCVSGYGGIVNRLLSLRSMAPLGRLSYLMYLTHFLVVMYRIASSKERTYLGHTEKVFQFFSTLVVTLIVSYIGYVAVEAPFSRLEKIVFRRRPKE